MNFFSYNDKSNFGGRSSINFLNEYIIFNYLKKDKKIFINSLDKEENHKIPYSNKKNQ